MTSLVPRATIVTSLSASKPSQSAGFFRQRPSDLHLGSCSECAEPKLAKVQEVQNLAARAAPMFFKAVPIDGN